MKKEKLTGECWVKMTFLKSDESVKEERRLHQLDRRYETSRRPNYCSLHPI
jgi:hypothetical protein